VFEFRSYQAALAAFASAASSHDKTLRIFAITEGGSEPDSHRSGGNRT
jgi:hypothetical protein